MGDQNPLEVVGTGAPIDPHSEENAAIEAALLAQKSMEAVKATFLKTAVKAVKTDTYRAKRANLFLGGLDYNQIAMDSYPPVDLATEKQTQFRLGIAQGDAATTSVHDVALFAVQIPAGVPMAKVEKAIAELVNAENVVSKSYFGSSTTETRDKLRACVFNLCELATVPECANAASSPPYYEYLPNARQIVAAEMNAL